MHDRLLACTFFGSFRGDGFDGPGSISSKMSRIADKSVWMGSIVAKMSTILDKSG